jgi:hypothetical protein
VHHLFFLRMGRHQDDGGGNEVWCVCLSQAASKTRSCVTPNTWMNTCELRRPHHRGDRRTVPVLISGWTGKLVRFFTTHLTGQCCSSMIRGT